ncbi:MAG TPA: hypothetical protein P5105_02835 [Victivallales bacterium]|nr:hypothetical protein [Victivallales bacterium]HRR28339.1 hypothetical protein [Victivallales bacterium]HRU02042.1 hypothetical protein [Victivallales bacterium]
MKKKVWIETFSGKIFHPFSPSLDSIDIVDIAHSLSMQCRFNGHCKRFYSVAEHSLNTTLYFEENYKNASLLSLLALLHDASEAYLSDIPRPIKPFIHNYISAERKLTYSIFAKFAQYQPSKSEWNMIMKADNAMLYMEALQLTSTKGKNWDLPEKPILNIKINCYTSAYAKKKFLDKFFELQTKIKKSM